MHGGEQHRSLLADLLWQRTKECITDYSEEQKNVLNRYFHEIKTPEDVVVRAKGILQRACEAGH